MYNNAGFPFCRIAPSSVVGDDGRTKTILSIEEGERVIIEDTYFRSEGRTDPGAAKRIANLKKGEYFARREVESAKKRLMATGAFRSLAEDIVTSGDRYYVLLSAKEAQSDLLTLNGSFSGTDTDKMLIGASLSSRSLLGTLRSLDFDYEYEKLFSIAYGEPVLIAPARAEVEFSILTLDTMRLTAGRLQFKAPVTGHLSIGIFSGIERVEYYGSDSGRTRSTDNLLGVDVGLVHDGRAWSFTQSIIFDYLFREADRMKAAYDAELEAWHFNIRVHYRRVVSDSIEFFDHVLIGGAQDLRGYLDDEFKTTRALWCNIEYHRLFIFPLLDIARIGGRMFGSYGFGISARSAFGDATLALAWPWSGTWSDGKIHLELAKGL